MNALYDVFYIQTILISNLRAVIYGWDQNPAALHFYMGAVGTRGGWDRKPGIVDSCPGKG
eukprot:1515362-Pleurochrysis_carterae.AAC.1